MKKQLIRNVNHIILLSWTAVGSLGLASFITFLFASICSYHLDVTLRPLFQRSRWDETQKQFASTYYERKCSVEDLSTRNVEDMLTNETWGVGEAVDRMMTHGALVFPNLVDAQVADQFRDHVIARNERLKPEEAVYVMNTHTKKFQTRWSFAFGPADDPSIPLLLQQVSANPLLKDTLEAFLGRDPAIIKMQTISSRYRAEPQGWHPDVNGRASALSHSRNFMMHFSLFIPLQDTTMEMGATGICPGSHYCTETDEYLQDQCIQVASGSNGVEPVWKVGDAVLMNQNAWHRGSQHSKWGAPDRAMSVITFTSRPNFVPKSYHPKPFEHRLPPPIHQKKQGNRTAHVHKQLPPSNKFDIRSLSLGSPLSSFGFTFSDLKDPTRTMAVPWSFFRYFGFLKPTNANWGWDWINSVFVRVSTESNGFKRAELSQYLRRLQGGSRLQKFHYRFFLEPKAPMEHENMGVWEVWLSKSLVKATANTWRASWIFLPLALVLWHWVRKIKDESQQRRSRLVCRVWIWIMTCFLGSVILGELLIQRSTLIKGIQSGVKLRTSFPSVIRKPNIGETVIPSRADVLVGTRFHSPSLFMANKILDRHPQNQALERNLQELVTRYDFPNLPLILQQQLGSEFIEGYRETQFLLQSPYTGNFTLLSNVEKRRYIQRAIVTKTNPWMQEMEDSILSMISAIRFESQERETAMAFIAANVLEDLLTKLFQDGQKTNATCSGCRSTRRLAVRRWVVKMPPPALVQCHTSRLKLPVSPVLESKYQVKLAEKEVPRSPRMGVVKPPPLSRRGRRRK